MNLPPDRYGICVKCEAEIVVEDTNNLTSAVVDHFESAHGLFTGE